MRSRTRAIRPRRLKWALLLAGLSVVAACGSAQDAPPAEPTQLGGPLPISSNTEVPPATEAVAAEPVAGALTGIVSDTSGLAIPSVFVGLLSEDYRLVDHTTTGPTGQFQFKARGDGALLVVQPAATLNGQGLGIYAHQPRIYALDGASQADIVLPAAHTVVLAGYDQKGNLLRWADFEQRGTFGRQFIYATNPRDEVLPAVPWPVYDETARREGSPREQGLPALITESGEPCVVQVLFWDVPGYGRLHLRADDAGGGYMVTEPGEALVLELNVELARSAVAALEHRKGAFPESEREAIGALAGELLRAWSLPTAPERAAAADDVLAEALELRDSLELELARTAIPELRMGRLRVEVCDASGRAVPGCPVRITQASRAFRFGVFEGSPYNAEAFTQARRAGFGLATVLPGWNWTDAENGGLDVPGIERVFGISALNALGFEVKAHGVVWLQRYGILPERAWDMTHAELTSALVEHEKLLIEAFSDQIALWEAMNEPAATNEVAMPRSGINALLARSAETIKSDSGSRTLVNSGHEVDYGHKFLLYGLDNAPQNDFPVTYSAALEQAGDAGALGQIDIIGLQFYPGFHFREQFAGLEGPAVPPAALVDLLDRYRAFGKPIHITEFSVPSTYGETWRSGYWRKPWDERTQADYAEAVFVLAFGTPGVRSITWWDITDAKPSVVTGGLIDAEGNPKEVFDRLQDLLVEWTTNASGETNAEGAASFEGFAGTYEVVATLPDGTIVQGEARVPQQDRAVIILKPQPDAAT